MFCGCWLKLAHAPLLVDVVPFIGALLPNWLKLGSGAGKNIYEVLKTKSSYRSSDKLFNTVDPFSSLFTDSLVSMFYIKIPS